MTVDARQLKHLITNVLPLASVGTQLRDLARRTAAGADPIRLRQVGRMVVDELLQSGDLVRVAVEGRDPRRGRLFLLRATNRLVDLGPLAPADGAARRSVPRSTVAPAPDAEVVESPPSATSPALSQRLFHVLDIMESAQSLEIGDPRSNIADVVLGGILDLLCRHTPGVELFLLLDRVDPVQGGDDRVFAREDDELMPFWLQVREPRSSVWLPSAGELPPSILAAAAARLATDSGDLPDVVAAAAPLLEPPAIAGDPHGRPREKGLLFLVSSLPWAGPDLLRVVQRLSRFVTRRWRHQWDVNQRIHTDSLTGVHNRAYFDVQFALELERAKRGGFPLTLILGDLDRFKRVNDSHGHLCGDRMLQVVARVLQGALRKIDHICRIGGEEFALVLPHTDEIEAQEVVARLLASRFVVPLVQEAGKGTVTVTMSYGTVIYPDAGAEAFELYRKADAMLYLSKDQGRHRCYFWRDDGRHLLQSPAPSLD